MTLWDMLDKTKYYQPVWIFETNDRGQNMPIFKGTVDEARRDGDNTWDYLPCEVERYDVSYGLLDIRVTGPWRSKTIAERYSGSDKWGDTMSERPWRYDTEIDTEKSDWHKYGAKGQTAFDR